MNCDLVFEILTRGPFPAGQPTDASVELHLLSCYECRQLAEALRPATSLIHEAIDGEETDLPGYHGELPVMTARPSAVASAVEAAIAEIAQETSQQPQQHSPVEVIVRKKQPWRKRRWVTLPFSLAMLAVAILAVSLVGLGMNQGADQPPATGLGSDSPHDANWQAVMAGLPLSCQKKSPESASQASAVSRASVALLSECCQCHMQPTSTASSLALADHSVGMCLACHTN